MPQSVLIVDDEDAVRTFLETVLRRAGYEVLAADSVPEGRHALKEGAPDLLITDVRLGGYNGLQLIGMSVRPIPAIVISGFVDPVLEADAYRMGARCLAKPLVAANLLALVSELLPTVQEDENRSSQIGRRLDRIQELVDELAKQPTDVMHQMNVAARLRQEVLAAKAALKTDS